MPRLTVTVTEALAEKLSRMSEHYGVTVSRLVSHACDSVLHEGATLSLGAVDSVSTNSVPSATRSNTQSRPSLVDERPAAPAPKPKKPCLVDTQNFRVPLGDVCGQEVKLEDIDENGYHTTCPGRWNPSA